MSFPCAASLHDLHLGGHSRPADFQEVTGQNSIVNMEYVSSLKFKIFGVTRKKLTCWYATQLFLIFRSNIEKIQVRFIQLKYALHKHFSTSKPDEHCHGQTHTQKIYVFWFSFGHILFNRMSFFLSNQQWLKVVVLSKAAHWSQRTDDI